MEGGRRLGIVLSVLWLIGFAWWLRGDDLEHARKAAGYDTCRVIYEMQYERLDSDRLVRNYHECVEKASALFIATTTPWWAIVALDLFRSLCFGRWGGLLWR